MKQHDYVIYGLIVLFLVVTVLSFPFSIFLSGIFLCATLAVASVTMIAGFRAGLAFYIIASIIIFLLPLRELLGLEEFEFRFFGFTIASSFLSLLSYRLKQAERNRNEQVLLMSAIVESSDDAIIGKTLQGQITSWNKGAERLFGYNSSEVIGKNIKILFPKDKYNEEDVILTKINAGESITHYETIRCRKDGTFFPASVTVSPIYDINKHVIGASNITRDISIRKQYEVNLAKSQERYKTFMENSEEAIFLIEYQIPIDIKLPVDEQIKIIQTTGTITEANIKMAQLYGFKTVVDVLGKEISSFIPASDEGKILLKKWISNNYSITSYESKSIDEQGHIRYGSTSFKGIIEDGHIVRAWVVQRETTEQKLQEKEREKLLKETEQSKFELEIASKEKDRFLANLSHELRTPLVSILGYSSMLLETEPNPEQVKTMITTINKNAKLQLQLIEDLLDLSRIISGKVELNKEYFSLTELIEESVDTFKPQAENKGLKLTVHSQDCYFYGDRKRLNQVILNLLSNAIKFTDSGEITVCTQCSDKFVTLKIRDTGIGIASKNFPQLFKPFKQLDSSSTRSKQGLGLGLSIV
jgi:PAS domain S-box-containing protein